MYYEHAAGGDLKALGALFSLVSLLIAWFGSAEDLDRRAITFGSLEVVFGNWATTLRMLPFVADFH